MLDWVKTHPYSSATLTAALLLVAGTILVIHRAAGPARAGAQAWGGGLTNFSDPSSYEPNAVLSSLSNTTVTTGYADSFLPIPPPPPLGEDRTDNETDLASIIASLVASYDTSGLPAVSSGNDSGQSGIYAFIPRGLIATSSPINTRTLAEQALYEYGNEVGSYIKSFESQYPGISQTLDDQARDRYNDTKGDAVRAIGRGLAGVGANLEHMEDVPASVASLHSALASSYKAAGEKLAAIPDAKSDEGFLAAIESYNAAAEVFAKRFVDLADFFAISNVRFSSGDSGSVFTFSFGGGF